MKTLTICGSMKFAQQMKKIAWTLESIYGYNVLQCVYTDGIEEISADALKRVKAAHYKKIDLCDAVYIVDIDGYIGESVTDEIRYAREKGKEIVFHSKTVQ